MKAFVKRLMALALMLGGIGPLYAQEYVVSDTSVKVLLRSGWYPTGEDSGASPPLPSDTSVWILRSGFFPPVVFPGETLVFRVDYRSGSGVDTVYISSDFDWSPFVLVSYRYLPSIENGAQSLQVLLRLPEDYTSSLVSTSVFKQPQLLWRLRGGEERVKVLSGVTNVRTVHIYPVSPNSGYVRRDKSVGSWWLKDMSLNGSEGVRDKTLLPIARGAGYVIYGLQYDLVNFSLLQEFGSYFKVWTEGPLLLYQVNPSNDSTDFYSLLLSDHGGYIKFQILDTFRTNHVPHYIVDSYGSKNATQTWRLFVLPKSSALDYETGKIIAALYSNGIELYRRELNFYVYGDYFKNNIAIMPYDSRNLIGDKYGVFYDCIKYSNPKCRENESGSLFFNYQYDQNSSFVEADVSVNLQYNISLDSISTIPPSPSELIECYEGVRGYYDCYDIFRSTGQDTFSINNQKYARLSARFILRYNPFLARSVQGRRRFFSVGILYANYYYWAWDYYTTRLLALYAPNGIYEIHQEYWDRRITEIRYTFLCKLIYANYSSYYRNCVLEGSESRSTTPITNSWKGKEKDLYSDVFNPFYGNLRLLFRLPPNVGDDSPSDWPSSPTVTVRLLSNPSVLRLQDLTEATDQRPRFEFLVEADQDGQPLANAPVVVEGPIAQDEIQLAEAPLFLHNPQQTDALGLYSFYWIPPPRSWFEGKTLPYTFRFRVRVGETWEEVAVQISNLIIQGVVRQRHAGAKLSQDPDLDGLLPVPNVEVSLNPEFPPEQTVRTGLDGRFELGVSEEGYYTVYARRREFWQDNFPKWSRTRARVLVTAEGPEPDTLRLFLAELPVRDVLQRWLPEITFDMESVRDSLAHLRIIPEIQSFLWQIATQDTTGPFDEEAVRRLRQAVFSTFDLLQGAHDMAECGTTAIWDGSVGIILQIVSAIVENLKLFEKVSKSIRAKLPADWKQSPDPKIQNLGRTLEMLEGIKNKFAELIRLIENGSAKTVNNLKEGMAHAALNNDAASLFTMNFLNERIFIPLSQLSSRIAKIAEDTKLDDFTKDLALSQAMEVSGVNGLLEMLNNAVKDLLQRGQLDELRATIATTLNEEIDLAKGRRFPTYPTSFYHAKKASDGWLEIMRRVRRYYLGSCEGIQGIKDQAEAALSVLEAGTIALAVATSGALTPLYAAVSKLNKVAQLLLNAWLVRTGVEVMTALQPKGRYGSAGLAAIRQAFSLKVPSIAMRVHSPVRLLVVDSLGRRIGADANNQVYMEIPGAGYWPASDSLPETILLPADIGPFKTLLHGTGSGTFALEMVQLDTLGNETVLRRWEGEVAPAQWIQLAVETPEQAVATGSLQALPSPVVLQVQQRGQPRDTITVPLGISSELEAVFLYSPTLSLPAQEVTWVVADTLATIDTVQANRAWIRGHHVGRTRLRLQAQGLEREAVLDIVGREVTLKLSRTVLTASDTVTIAIQVRAWGVALPENLLLQITAPAGSYRIPVRLDATGTAQIRWQLPDSLRGQSGPASMAIYEETASDTTLWAAVPFVLTSTSILPDVLAAEVTHEGNVVAKLQVPTTLLPHALEPELLVDVADSLPGSLPTGFAPLGPAIGWSLWDRAQAIAVVPTGPYVFSLWSGAYQGTPQAFYWSETGWEALETRPAAGFWEVELSYAGGIIVLARSEQVVAVESTRLPERISLEAYPNPFGKQLRIRIGIPKAGKVRLVLYDLLGREVLPLYEGEQTVGWHEQSWETSNLASGLYLLVLEGEGFRTTKTIVKVR